MSDHSVSSTATPVGWYCRLVGWILTAFGVLALGTMLATERYETRYSVGFDMVGATLFVAVGCILLISCACTWPWRLCVVMTLATAYVGSYATLSAQGSYFFEISGKNRYASTGMAITDVNIWYPLGMHWKPFVSIYGERTTRGNLLGYFYCPLMWIDQRWVHPTFSPLESPVASDL